MNSGDHGLAVSTPLPQAPIQVPQTAVNPQGATVQSLPPAPPPAVMPRRSLAPMIGVALASAAIGAIVLYFVTRSPDDTRPAEPDATVIAVSPPPDTAPAPQDTTLAIPADAALVADAVIVEVRDAAVADARPPGGQTARPDPVAGGDEKAPPHGDNLALAKRELAAGNAAAAGKLVEAIIVSQDANDAQRLRARSLRAITHCIEFDEEKAGNQLRAIPLRYRALRKQVLARCHASQLLLTTTQ